MALLSSLPNIAVMLLGFGVLIFVHELGHFLAAKWAGIRSRPIRFSLIDYNGASKVRRTVFSSTPVREPWIFLRPTMT